MANETRKGLDKVFDWYLAERCGNPDTEDVQIALDKCEEVFERAAKDIEVVDALTSAVCDYGEERERKGFKDGFQIAFQIFNDMHMTGKKVP